jgi:dihydrofolate reductase
MYVSIDYVSKISIFQTMKISMIVAAAQNGAIGRDNQLIWRLPDDLKRFKTLTMGRPIIMGRKTFESIGKPLSGRTSIVISRNSGFKPDGCVVVNNLTDAIEVARKTATDEVFIIGGAAIYTLAQPMINKIYLTEVKADFEGDAFFEITYKDHWHETERTHHPTDEKHTTAFDFVTLERN